MEQNGSIRPNTFASGLRSEHSLNRSLAGSSRDSAATVYQKFDHTEGLGTHRNDWVCNAEPKSFSKAFSSHVHS